MYFGRSFDLIKLCDHCILWAEGKLSRPPARRFSCQVSGWQEGLSPSRKKKAATEQFQVQGSAS